MTGPGSSSRWHCLCRRDHRRDWKWEEGAAATAVVAGVKPVSHHMEEVEDDRRAPHRDSSSICFPSFFACEISLQEDNRCVQVRNRIESSFTLMRFGDGLGALGEENDLAFAQCSLIATRAYFLGLLRCFIMVRRRCC